MTKSPAICYRVMVPIQSVRLRQASGERGVIETIPAGSLLEFEGPSALSARMVEVLYAEERYAIFGEDLKSRTQSA